MLRIVKTCNLTCSPLKAKRVVIGRLAKVNFSSSPPAYSACIGFSFDNHRETFADFSR
jgi:hypothetical protein